MEEVQAAVTAHLDQVSGLVQALSSELRSGIGPAADSLRGFVRAVDWTEPWLMGLMAFHASLLLTAVGLRRHANLQFFLLFLAYSGVYLAQKINIYLAEHWKSFASQNYFDRAGVFISVVWSGPLIFISIVSVVSSLITLCQLMIKLKRAELRHRVRLARDKQE
ncbi:transmembrane protein 18-like isoform X1 [Lolium rigidum]|uniref:transmembrane protein 18-like isoform X1 n=1 Tax=Lolium rigidum TaxID=89674 RepID=UPI001F5CDAE5|nr:transmembrane protein 18-like isoform X1 [Lolium rigidum]